MTGEKILVVVDNPCVLRILKDLFQAAGANVFGSTSGVEGLRQFHAHRPDLLVLDLILPDLSGWEMYCRIGDTTRAPVIFLTGLPEQHYHPPGLAAGAVDYVAKPFSPVELLRRAREALGDSLVSPGQGGQGARRSSSAHRPDVREVSTRHQFNVQRFQGPGGVNISLGGAVGSWQGGRRRAVTGSAFCVGSADGQLAGIG